MLSGSVRALLVCPSCRQATRRGASRQFTARNLLRVSSLPRRSYASDGPRYSKEKVENLIRGGRREEGNNSSPEPNAKTKTSSSSTDNRENHHESDTSARRNGVDGSEEPDAHTPERPSSAPTESPDKEPRRTRAPHLRPFRHELLQHKNLSVDALGKPVDAILIKNPNRLRKPKKQIPVMEEDKGATRSQAKLSWESLLREGKPSNDPTTEAMNNIEEMRPLNTRVLSQKEFENLASDLVEGFTHKQLSAYIATWHSTQTPEVDAMMEYSWAKRFISWEPTEDYTPTSSHHKARVANAILQKIWNIDIRERVEGRGQAVIWMEPNTYHLLAKTSNQTLTTLRNDFLDPTNNERIISDPTESRLTIHSRKSTFSIILARLDEFAKSIVSQEISTETLPGDIVDNEVLEGLRRITETGITVAGDKKTVTVSWLPGPDRPQVANTNQDLSSLPEDPAGIVRRLLMVANDDKPINYKSKTITPFPKDKSNIRFVPHHHEKRNMSWRDELFKWTRHVCPTGRSLPSRLEPLKLASGLSLPKPPCPIQSSGHATSISATFGHILQAQNKKSGPGRRMLSPVVPHPAALTAIAPDDQPIHQAAAIILKFTPDPTDSTDTSNTPDSVIPQVHLRLPIDPDTDMSLFRFPPTSTLNGIIPSHTRDALFPTENVDVRITQEHVLPLDVNQPSLQDFLSASEFDLLEGRLRTPSQVTFAVPSNPEGESSSQTQQVLYMFAGLEIHQTVETTWKSNTLRYTSIEAGRYGGQRQELSLHPSFSSSSDSDPSTTTSATTEMFNEQDFLQAVQDIVTGDLFPWNDGHTLMRTPDDIDGEEGYSADLLEDGGAAYREEDLADELPSVVPPEVVGDAGKGSSSSESQVHHEDDVAGQSVDGEGGGGTKKE